MKRRAVHPFAGLTVAPVGDPTTDAVALGPLRRKAAALSADLGELAPRTHAAAAGAELARTVARLDAAALVLTVQRAAHVTRPVSRVLNRAAMVQASAVRLERALPRLKRQGGRHAAAAARAVALLAELRPVAERLQAHTRAAIMAHINTLRRVALGAEA